MDGDFKDGCARTKYCSYKIRTEHTLQYLDGKETELELLVWGCLVEEKVFNHNF
jgi:hypothetical protein